VPSVLRNSLLYLPKCETVCYVLRIKEQFLVPSKLRISFLRLKNYERIFVPSVLRNSLLYLPNCETAYCALRLTKQLLLPTSEEFLVLCDLTKQFLVRCEFRTSLLLPPYHGTVSCALRSTKPFVVSWELRSSILHPPITERFLAPSELRNSLLCPSNNSFLCPTSHGTVSHVSRISIEPMLFAAQISVMFWF
jgi:hypothetical protein